MPAALVFTESFGYKDCYFQAAFRPMFYYLQKEHKIVGTYEDLCIMEIQQHHFTLYICVDVGWTLPLSIQTAT